MSQVTTTRKRKKVGDDLYMYEEEPYVPPQKTTETYLNALFTYLLALAMAGSSKVPGVSGAEEFGSDATQFVLVPWDILEAYYFRACSKVRQVPEGFRADWLEKCDVAERAVWVTKFRSGNLTLGQVVKQVYTERNAHWEVSPVFRGAQQSQVQSPPQTPQGRQPPQQMLASPQKSARPQSQGGGSRPQSPGGPQVPAGQAQLAPGQVAKQLRDGTVLCPDFQQDNCKVKKFKCPKGIHKCGMVLKSGRVCGMPYHSADKCKRQDQ
jgi:hypothetical protein